MGKIVDAIRNKLPCTEGDLERLAQALSELEEVKELTLESGRALMIKKLPKRRISVTYF